MSGDLVERGPGHWRVWRRDLDLARRRLHNNAIRFGIEWSRIFPRSTEKVKVGRGRITRATTQAARQTRQQERRAPLPPRPTRRPGPRPAHHADAPPLHAAAVDPRSGRASAPRSPGGRGRPAAGRPRARRMARPGHRHGVPQVRGLRRVEVRRPRAHLGDDERATRAGIAGVGEHPRCDGGEGPRRALLHRGGHRSREPGAGQRRGV